MTNLTHTHMNKIGIPTVLESSAVQIESSLFALVRLDEQSSVSFPEEQEKGMGKPEKM